MGIVTLSKLRYISSIFVYLEKVGLMMKMYQILCCMLMSGCKVSKNALPIMLPCIPENFELSLLTVDNFYL
jgi:hypothetical protein